MDVPGGHGAHAATSFAPSAAFAVPAGQSAHAVCPVAFCHVPAGHDSHVVDPAAEENAPAGQKAHVAEPGVDADDPAAHFTHDVSPSTGWCSPGGHASHAPARDVDANVPAAHFAHVAEPAGANVPGGHASHDDAPGDAETSPAAHGAHASDDSRLENDPGGQSSHSYRPSSGPARPAAHAHDAVSYTTERSGRGQSKRPASEKSTTPRSVDASLPVDENDVARWYAGASRRGNTPLKAFSERSKHLSAAWVKTRASGDERSDEKFSTRESSAGATSAGTLPSRAFPRRSRWTRFGNASNMRGGSRPVNPAFAAMRLTRETSPRSGVPAAIGNAPKRPTPVRLSVFNRAKLRIEAAERGPSMPTFPPTRKSSKSRSA